MSAVRKLTSGNLIHQLPVLHHITLPILTMTHSYCRQNEAFSQVYWENYIGWVHSGIYREEVWLLKYCIGLLLLLCGLKLLAI